MNTVAALLADAAAALTNAGIDGGAARGEVRTLLAAALGASSESLIAHPEREVAPQTALRFLALVHRRAQREPLPYLVGTKEFYGLLFAVTPAVLIPRPETELLVEAVLGRIGGNKGEGAKVADIGTGSGCIAVAVAVHAPQAEVWATDISPQALAVAGANARRHNVTGRVHFEEGDLLAPLASAGPFAAIVSNPPYIAPADIETLEPEVRDWEPRLALGLHPDALLFYRRLAQEAPPHLEGDGLLAVEVGQGQAEAVAELWQNAGLRNVAVTGDLAGIERVVSGLWY